jgi:hypothetical protein
VALASYFRRSAVAAAQALGGYKEGVIRERLEGKTVALLWDSEATALPEGRVLIEFSLRLLSRFYPRLSLTEPEGEWAELARSINGEVEIGSWDPDIAIGIGPSAERIAPLQIFAGSEGWDAFVAQDLPQPLGASSNPFGASAAACLAAAAAFRAVFLKADDPAAGDCREKLSVLDLTPARSRENTSIDGVELGGETALVGIGAIGNSAVWTLARAPLRGAIHLVDAELLDEGNLQRYVLCGEADVGQSKVAIAERFFTTGIEAIAHSLEWADFVAERGYEWDRVLVALDSAKARREVQASLPRWLANAWTQPGDLGISVHPWSSGACLNCLYLPAGETQSEDVLVADALGVPEAVAQVRNLLHTNQAPPPALLEQIAIGLGAPRERVAGFAGRPLRELYVEGICGGVVLPLDRAGRPAGNVHVPLAPQSALAGVLLAGRLVAAALGRTANEAAVTRIDLLRPLQAELTQPAAKDPRSICICQDSVYREAYAAKYGAENEDPSPQ